MIQNNNIEVRRAEPTDAVAILNLLKMLSTDMAVSYPAIDDAHALHWIIRTMQSGIVFVATLKEKIAGSVGLHPEQFPWNPTYRYLCDQWFAVHPKARSTAAAKQLIGACKAIADEFKAPLVMGVMHGAKADLKDRFIGMQGFTYMGGNFTYNFGERNE